MERIWKIFPKIFQAVKQSHEEVKLVGHHDINHALRVGDTAHRIALEEWDNEEVANLAGVAGLCHNADRILQKKLDIDHRDVPREKVKELVMSWLEKALVIIDRGDRETIFDAVIKHDGKNGDNDSQALIALMDADRVVNLDPDLIIRSGQYYHDLPAVDFIHFLSDPEARYGNPKSVLYDIACALEWVDEKTRVCVRTKLGKKLGAERAAGIRSFIDTLKARLEESGLHPSPFANSAQ